MINNDRVGIITHCVITVSIIILTGFLTWNFRNPWFCLILLLLPSLKVNDEKGKENDVEHR